VGDLVGTAIGAYVGGVVHGVRVGAIGGKWFARQAVKLVRGGCAAAAFSFGVVSGFIGETEREAEQ
jgi:uncharacterized protein YcfJ